MPNSTKAIIDKYHSQYSGVAKERQDIIIQLNAMNAKLSALEKDNPERLIIVKAKNELITKLQIINTQIKVGGATQVNLFRDVVGESLSLEILERVMDEVRRRQNGEPVRKITLYSDKDENALNYFNQLDERYKALFDKIKNAREEIQKMMPTLKGPAMAPAEYDRRAELMKVLSRILALLK